MLFYSLVVKKCFPTFGRVTVPVLGLGHGVDEYVEEKDVNKKSEESQTISE